MSTTTSRYVMAVQIVADHSIKAFAEEMRARKVEFRIEADFIDSVDGMGSTVTLPGATRTFVYFDDNSTPVGQVIDGKFERSNPDYWDGLWAGTGDLTPPASEPEKWVDRIDPLEDLEDR